VEAFMKIWADGAHYQCREVDVYATQIENGDMQKNVGSPTDFNRRLKNMYVYANGDQNSPGCANSKWAIEFKPYLNKAAQLLKEHNFDPAKAGVKN
jgi:hypothetical protein